MTNVSEYKAGAALGLVKISNGKDKIVVTGKELKLFVGIENTFLLKDK